MDELQDYEVFAEREFHSHNTAGEETQVILRIGKPQIKAHGVWYCPVQIIGIGDEKIEAIAGADSLQALLLGLQLGPTLLRYFAKSEQKKITWLGQDDLGFQ
jgi:uncharacterized protein DUF6968